ncbi:MAG: hypothetical protein ACLFUJ_16215 [Phycisphaerae bacterium]
MSRALFCCLLTALLLSAGCDGEADGYRYRQAPSRSRRPEVVEMMESWVGERASRVLDAWGEPDHVWKLTNGGREYGYQYVESADREGPGLFDVAFLVNRDGIVYHYSYHRLGD